MIYLYTEFVGGRIKTIYDVIDYKIVGNDWFVNQFNFVYRDPKAKVWDITHVSFPKESFLTARKMLERAFRR